MQHVLLGLIDQSWFVKTTHLCCNSCPGQVATWISWPGPVWVMKWLWTAWPLHCSEAATLPLVLWGSHWREDLSPEFTPQWVLWCPSGAAVSSLGCASDVATFCLLTAVGTTWQPSIVKEVEGGFLGAGGKLSSLRLQCISLLLGCMGLLHFSRANAITLSPISLWALFEWNVLGDKVPLWKYFVMKM